MFNKGDSIDFNEMDKAKCEALVELSHLAAKQGGYVEKSGDSIKDYLIPMINTLTGEKLITEENEFDELLYVLQQYCPKFMYDQLDLKSAKDGNKVEVMKFFAAFVRQFRVIRSVLFNKLCEAMSQLNQLQITHFVSYMDNAVQSSDINWWHVLFLAYTDEEINAVSTPLHITSTEDSSSSGLFDGSTYNVANSSAEKDQLVQEFERRLKAERNLVELLRVDYDASSTKIDELNLKIATLERKLERANKNAISMCGDECPNKGKMAVMQIKSNIRENKFQKLTTDFLNACEELEVALEAADELQLENLTLEERNTFLEDENDRLSKSFKELLDLRQKMSELIKEKEELFIQQLTNDNFMQKAKLLESEAESLRKHKDGLIELVAVKETVANKLKEQLDLARSENFQVKTNDVKQPLDTKVTVLTHKLDLATTEIDNLKKQLAEAEQALDLKDDNSQPTSKTDEEVKKHGSVSKKLWLVASLVTLSFLLSRVYVSYAYDESFTLFGSYPRGVSYYMPF